MKPSNFLGIPLYYYYAFWYLPYMFALTLEPRDLYIRTLQYACFAHLQSVLINLAN